MVTIDAEIPAKANGVLYKLGGFAGGLTCYVQGGVLSHEYNLFEVQRTRIKATEKLPVGKAKIGSSRSTPSRGRRAPWTSR